MSLGPWQRAPSGTARPKGAYTTPAQARNHNQHEQQYFGKPGNGASLNGRTADPLSAQGLQLFLRDVGAHVGQLFGKDVDDVVLDLVIYLHQSVVHEPVLVALLQGGQRKPGRGVQYDSEVAG